MGALTQQTRDRIVGGVFIGALIVLLAPLVIDRHEIIVSEVVDIKPPHIKPNVPNKEIPPSEEIESTGKRLSSLIDDEGYWADSGTLIGEPILGEDLEKQGLKPTWAVQVASFIEEENAVSLRNELATQDLVAWLVHVRKNGRKVTRVGVGPMISLEAAKNMQERLIETYPESIIVSFQL